MLSYCSCDVSGYMSDIDAMSRCVIKCCIFLFELVALGLLFFNIRSNNMGDPLECRGKKEGGVNKYDHSQILISMVQ